MKETSCLKKALFLAAKSCSGLEIQQLFKQNSGFLLEYNYSQSDLALFVV